MPFLAPVIGAIGSALGAIGSFTIGGIAVGKILIGIGLNVASALIQNALKKKPKGGTKLEREYGADVSRSVACGLVGVAGHDVYINTYNSGNKELQQIYVLSDYPGDSLSRVAINGEWATLGETDHPDYGREVTSGDYAGLIWVKFVDGKQTAASSYLIDNANPAERWTADHVGVGVCYALVSMFYHEKKNYQFPDFFFEFWGAKLYDWRKDSSVGGSGSHRWNDPSTHEYSANPIVIDYNYRRGFSVNGDMFCGMGMDPDDLPLAQYTLAANLCDEINIDDGKPRYACSILLDAGPDTTHGDNIESLMLSCGGMVVDGVEGSWPIVGSDQPTVATITDDDLIVGAPVRFRKTRSMGEVVNSISGNYPEPDEFWGMTGYERQLSDTGLVLDRRTRDLGMDFPQVSLKRQAEQLAHIYLEESRLEATETITVRARWQGLQPGDWITRNSARYGNRTMMVAEASLVSLDGENPRCVQLSLVERDGVIYDGVSSPDIVLPWPPGTPELLAEVDNFQVIAVRVEGSGEKESPGIRASWTAIDDPTVTHVELRYWPVDQTDAVIYHPPVEADVSTTLIVSGLVGNTDYWVQSRLITNPPRVVAWAAGKGVKTDDVHDAFWPIDLDALAEDVRNLHEWLGQGNRDLRDEILTLATAISEMDLANYEDKEQASVELTATYNGVSAEYKEAITVATGPGSLIAQRIETIELTIPQLATLAITNALTGRIEFTESTMLLQGSAITAIQGALTGFTGANAVANAFSALDVKIEDIEGDVTAISNAVLGVESAVDNFSANGYFRVYSEAASSGALSRIGMSLSATAGGATSAAALFLEAIAGGKSRLIADANEFYFGDFSSGAVLNPFVYFGGQWYIGTINIENAIVGNLLVDTHNIATGAVSEIDATDQGSGSTSINNTGVGIRTMAFTGAAGAGRLVKGYVDINGSDGGGNGVPYDVTVQLYRDSVLLKSKTITMYPVTTDGSNGFWQTEQVIFARDTGGTASDTYYLWAYKQALTPALYATNGYLEVLELKR